MSENTNNTSEEVDLIKLFKLIGDGFGNMFKSIGVFFGRIFHFVIISLIFLKKHFIKIAITSILGGSIGFFLQNDNQFFYQSDSVIETNLGSGLELYNQVNKINTLIDRGDYEKLATVFDISESETKKILKLTIEPFEKEKNILREFDYYKQHTDTIFTRDLTPKIYANKLQNEDYRLQKITAYSYEQTIFNKLNKGVSKLAHNDYYKNLVRFTALELESKQKVLKKNIALIDSMMKVNNEATLLSAKNLNSITNISINKTQRKKDDKLEATGLFGQLTLLLEQLDETNEEILRSAFITKTVSEFEIGYVDNKLFSSKWLKYGVMGGLLMIFGILAIQFNKYLDNYNK